MKVIQILVDYCLEPFVEECESCIVVVKARVLKRQRRILPNCSVLSRVSARFGFGGLRDVAELAIKWMGFKRDSVVWYSLVVPVFTD